MNEAEEASPTRSHSAGAERMRLHRRRRRYRLRPFKVELSDTDIDEMVTRGFLDPTERKDVRAIGDAATAVISDALVPGITIH